MTVYPLFALLGIISAYLLILLRGYPQYRKQYHLGILNRRDITRAFSSALLGVLIGARIGYIFFHWSYYASDLIRMFFIWEGGLIFHGGLAGGLAASWIYCRLAGRPWLELLDFSAAPLAFGYALGRIGCFFNGCCAGTPTDLPWAMVFPFFGEATRHPAQLYSAASALLLFLILDRVYQRNRGRGFTFSLFLILHGIYRGSMEFIRVEPTVAFGLTHGQLFSAIMILTGGFLLRKILINHRRTGG